jgi:hypothetical protein
VGQSYVIEITALRAAQPYLCGTAKGASKEPAAEKKRQKFWEVAKDAADDLIIDGLKKAVEPVCVALIKLVPFLSFAPTAFTFGFSVVAVHYAKKGYCNLKIQEEIIQTLKLRSNTWENR